MTTSVGATPRTYDEILATLREALVLVAPEVADVYRADPASIPAAASLKDDLGVDSLSLLELVARAEYQFGLSVPDDDWPLLVSLDAIAMYVIAGGRP